MDEIAVQAAAASQQNGWNQEQAPVEGAAAQEGGEAETVRKLPDHAEEESKSLAEMIKDAQEKAEAHRSALKVTKNSTRYGDAPLEAYARLARAKTASQVDAASGFARRRIAQLRGSLHLDSENATKIKSAINQLQKAVNRGAKKKRDLNREQMIKLRKARSKEAERRRDLELVRRRTQRMIRESGYLREADIAGRLAAQLTETQMELRSQAQSLAAANATSLETAVQQYAAEAASAGAETAAPAAAISVQG